ncbi:MAG: serine/threonine protein kinase [Myxococcales bacterium]|nr:serine/threonine protein kinase [Myxococcales bacterium]
MAGPSKPADDIDVEDDFDLVDTVAATSSRTLMTPGGEHPWQGPDSLIGTLLGERYSLVRLIGQGGMGAVYQAHHVVIGKTIAVKVLSPDYSRNPGDVQRFLQEARAASLIRHDHVVDIADFGYTEHGQAYLVMEYLEGEDLAETAQTVGRMPWFRVSNIVMQIGSALAAAHAKGIIHRDMKPENCFRVKRDGDADFIKVLDFGIAKIVDDKLSRPNVSLTIEGGVIGTPEYIAPELCRGQKADSRVDIYALGIIMYRLLTGVVPFTAENGNYMAVLSQHLTTPPTPPREAAPDAAIPEKIEQIVLRALEKDPARRYQKVEELIAALRDAQLTLTGASSTGILTTVKPIVPRKLGPPSRLPLLAALIAVILGGVAVTVWALVGGRTDAEATPPPAASTTNQPIADAPPPVVAARPEPAPPTPAATSSGSSSDGDESDGADEPPPTNPGRLPETLSASDFRRTAANIQKALKRSCKGLPGMSVGARISIEPDGKVSRVVPEGGQAGSSFSSCVIKQVRATRFRKAQRASTHFATFKL